MSLILRLAREITVEQRIPEELTGLKSMRETLVSVQYLMHGYSWYENAEGFM